MEKAVFLDRDGVINEVLSKRVKFVNKPSDLYILKGVPESIAALTKAGYKVFVVTNQGGIGLGYMEITALEKVHEKMKQKIEVAGGVIEDIAYCPHKPHAGCTCRKPEAKMILDLSLKHHVALEKSVMVGDREPDIVAGKNAGVGRTVFIGRTNSYGADVVFPDLLSAVPWILEE